MATGAIAFAVVFVLAPLLLFAMAFMLPSAALSLALGGLVLLATGFTLGVGALPR